MTRHVKCCVPGCESRGSQDEITFHKFPPDADSWMVRCVHPDGRVDKLRRRKIWEDRLLYGRSASGPYRVCSLHFESNDFLPKWEGRARKSNHLKKTALPSCNLPPHAEDDSSSEPDGEVLKTTLPDGTVCEFFAFEEDRVENSESLSSSILTRSPTSSITDDHSDDRGSTCEAAVTDSDSSHNASAAVRKRKASEDPLAQLDGLKSCRKNQIKEEPGKCSRKVVDIFDFEGVIGALENGTLCLPSASWSYSLLNRSVFMFLCWDEHLRLIKKAVLRKGSPIELFCDDRLLASRAELPIGNYCELELALRYLDKYEWCPGTNPEGIISSECESYILRGKARCTPCDNLMTVLQNDIVGDHSFDEIINEVPEIVMEGYDSD